MASYEYDSQNQELHRIAGGTLYADCPIGSYIPFGGTVIPIGWLLCNGQAVSRTDYADLFAVIGTAYGSGDGSTTFNIPDLREAVPKGAGLTGKSNNHMDADGLAVGEFLDDRLQEHTHKVNMPAKGLYAQAGDTRYGDNYTLDYTSESDNARHGATTEVKSVGSNYIIKAKQIGVPADFASAIEDVIVNRATTEKVTNRTGNDATIRNRPSEKILGLNALDETKTGISIDFNFQSGSINVYYVLNGVTQGMKSVNIT